MAPLTSSRRNALPGKDFAGPNRSYPINNASHARNALSRAAQFASPAEVAEIRAKVHAKFPNIGKGGAHPREHALAKASAKHLHKMGHISQAHHDKIHKAASKGHFGAMGAGHYLSTPTPVGEDEGGM